MSNTIFPEEILGIEFFTSNDKNLALTGMFMFSFLYTWLYEFLILHLTSDAFYSFCGQLKFTKKKMAHITKRRISALFRILAE